MIKSERILNICTKIIYLNKNISIYEFKVKDHKQKYICIMYVTTLKKCQTFLSALFRGRVNFQYIGTRLISVEYWTNYVMARTKKLDSQKTSHPPLNGASDNGPENGISEILHTIQFAPAILPFRIEYFTQDNLLSGHFYRRTKGAATPEILEKLNFITKSVIQFNYSYYSKYKY